MSIRVKIPAALRDTTNGEAEVYGDGTNIKNLLSDLNTKYPGLMESVYEDSGRLQRFLTIFVNDTNIQTLQSERTQLEDGDEVVIISAVTSD
jgi:molybdopterin synthase sulfur carrier subunit